MQNIYHAMLEVKVNIFLCAVSILENSVYCWIILEDNAITNKKSLFTLALSHRMIKPTNDKTIIAPWSLWPS